MPAVILEQELQLLEVAGRIARGDPTGLPWGLGARRPVAVAGRADRRRVVEHRVPAGRPPARQVVASQPAPAPFRVLATQPSNDPPPGVLAQVLKGPRRLPGAEVDAPATQHRVEPVQELVERLIGAAAGDLLDLRLDGRKRRLRREREVPGRPRRPRSRLMRQPRKSIPSSMWVMRVFAVDSVSPSGRSTCAVSVASASACCRSPATQMTKSSA
jgi:hypothetical protein